MYEIFEQLLQSRGITAYRVSKETGVSQATLSAWKAGDYIPKAEKLQKIAAYFGVSLEYLMTGKEPEQREKPTLNKEDELNDYLEELKNRSEMRMLFKLAKGATKEDVEKAVRIIEALNDNQK